MTRFQNTPAWLVTLFFMAACGGGSSSSSDVVPDEAGPELVDTLDAAPDACGVAKCDDGLTCTVASCGAAGQCQYAIASGSCLIQGACYADGDLNPANPCQTCRVSASQITWRPEDASSCDDGDPCTTGDACSSGACVGTALECNDGDPCTTDSCDVAAGCVHADNTSPCDDGDACTNDDTCSLGACVGVDASADCDDGNVCTTDSCDPATGCGHDDNTLACDDGNECTQGDVCTDGVCVGVDPLGHDCDDGNPCTTDTCTLADGCQYQDNDLACDDGDPCTATDTCQAGACTGDRDASCSSGTVDENGGVVGGASGGVTLPAGALEGEVEVLVRSADVASDLPVDGVPGGDLTVGANGGLALEPSDLVLLVPGFVTRPLAISARPNILVPAYVLNAEGSAWTPANLADGSAITAMVSPTGDSATFVVDRFGTYGVSSLPQVFRVDTLSATPMVRPAALFSNSAEAGLPGLTMVHAEATRQAAYEEVLLELVLRTGKDRSANERDLGDRLAAAVQAYDDWKGTPDFGAGALWLWLSDLLATVPALGGQGVSAETLAALDEMAALLDDFVDTVDPAVQLGACTAEGFLTGGLYATLDHARARDRLTALRGVLEGSALYEHDEALRAALVNVQGNLDEAIEDLWTPFTAFVEAGIGACGADLVTNVGTRLAPWIVSGVFGLTGPAAVAITLSYRYLLKAALFQPLGEATNKGVSLAILGTLAAYGVPGEVADEGGGVPGVIDLSNAGQRDTWLAAQTATYLLESGYRVTADVLATGDASLFNRALVLLPGFLANVDAVRQAFDDEADTHGVTDQQISGAFSGYCAGLDNAQASPLCTTSYVFPGLDEAPTGVITAPADGTAMTTDFDVVVEAVDDHAVRTATVTVATAGAVEVFHETIHPHATTVSHTWHVTGTSAWGVGTFTVTLWLSDGAYALVQADSVEVSFASLCEPDCVDRECGADGCDGTCGSCSGDETCTLNGQCAVDPSGTVWIALAGGTYSMGSTTGAPDEEPVHDVSLSPFFMAKSEATAAQYQACVDSGVCSAAWDLSAYCTAGAEGKEQHPINCVNWIQAGSFCSWSGGRLCTEAEWEYAARSGGQAQKYPWGDATATCDYAVMFGKGDRGCGLDSTWAVCSKTAGNSAQGVCDLAGSVWEWVADRYGPYPATAQTNPTGPVTGSDRVRRGGSWGFDYADNLRAAFRYYAGSYYADDYLGVRCCRDGY